MEQNVELVTFLEPCADSDLKLALFHLIRSLRGRDRQGLEAVLAPDALMQSRFARDAFLDRASYIELMTATDRPAMRHLRFTGVAIKAHDDAVIATGVLGTHPGGEEEQHGFRFSQVTLQKKSSGRYEIRESRYMS
jgi:hypothetical protein